MGFVGIFWKNNIERLTCQNLALHRANIIVLEILVPVSPDNSVQILLNLTHKLTNQMLGTLDLTALEHSGPFIFS